MKCPFKENESCCKQVGVCALGVFLTILGVAVALKIITLILCIFPGSVQENTWLVVISIVLVLFAAKYHSKGNCSCGPECGCPCNKNQTGKKCCDKNQQTTQDNSQ
ncbi:hypothetical protein CGC45_00025 [Francisella opportunistica]|uniref:Uncharacterized protein n=2 Tax=Francisellaceae TaxID=34064 RepID=A0A345JTM5_9GAMM|nr:hypothetical protein BBG19_0005 [Francisella sp. MA067296]AXH30671.1 hypothetical protein CGC43_00025 [Francisella opportunistica]AXH30742.1 hypothetical protein CGC44_00025 [Francisella opportunistica]AXH32388.1 hypothetical protein CGC45_00025 [Francisella opportunistica]